MRTTDTTMKPEDRRALQNLLAVLDKSNINHTIMSSDVWTENRLSFFSLPFATKRIPSGNNWRWNQSRAKKEIYLQQYNAQVVIAKLIARKTKDSDTAPNYKLWQFTVTFLYSKREPLVVLWCEKGRKETKPLHSDVSPLCSTQEPSSKLYAAKISFICN